MEMASARLIVQQGRYQNKEFDITQKEVMSVGRSPENDIAIDDPEISRQHARLLRQGTVYTLEDLNSTNGSFVNGERIRVPTRLYHNDVVNFGDAIFLQFVNPADDDTPPQSQMKTITEGVPFGAPVAPPAMDVATPPTPAPNRTRRFMMGCVAAFVLSCCLFLMLIIFLDSYQQGQLLYCGGLRSFFNLILGPLGFSPACP